MSLNQKKEENMQSIASKLRGMTNHSKAVTSALKKILKALETDEDEKNSIINQNQSNDETKR